MSGHGGWAYATPERRRLHYFPDEVSRSACDRHKARPRELVPTAELGPPGVAPRCAGCLRGGAKP